MTGGVAPGPGGPGAFSWVRQCCRSQERESIALAIEDAILEKERQGHFDAEFGELSRQVYLQNDRCAVLKRQINQVYGSELCEEKAYASCAS